MKANTYRACDHAVVIHKSDLEGFYDLFCSRYCEPRFKAECNEGSTLEFDSLQELLAFENHQFRRIDEIAVYFGDDRGHGSLVLRSSIGGRATTMIIADHDSDRAFVVADDVEKRLRSCKPSYSFLSRVLGGAVVAVVFFAFGSVMFWTHVITTGSLAAVSFPLLSTFYITLPIVPLFFLVAKYANRYWEWLFPKVWFCLGRQEAEYGKRSNVRKTLAVSVGLALVVSVIAGVVTSAITG